MWGFMRILFFLIFAQVVSLSFAPTVTAASAVAAISKRPLASRLEVAAAYQNSFSTFRDLFNEMQAFGGLSREERTEIETLLTQNGVALETPMKKATLRGNVISWSGEPLTFAENGSVKVRSGVVLQAPNSEARDQAFRRIFLAELGRKQAKFSPVNLFVFEARAGEVLNTVTAASIAMGRTLFTALSAAATPLCGALLVPLDGLLWATKKLIYEGTVSCSESGDYVMNNYGEFFSQFAKDYREAHGRIGKTIGYVQPVENASSATCLSPFVRAMGEEMSMPESRLKQNRIAPAHVQGAFSGEKRPCTDENAAVVETFVKTEAKKIDTFTKQASVETRFGKTAESTTLAPAAGTSK
jgi:hypothetical protein